LRLQAEILGRQERLRGSGWVGGSSESRVGQGPQAGACGVRAKASAIERERARAVAREREGSHGGARQEKAS
jgi:hypothetical protein